MHVKLMKDVPFKMVAHRVNMRYSKRETVELVQNEGSDLEDFLESCSLENIADSGKEFASDLEVDLSDSNSNIFIIGIRATSRIKKKI